MKYPRKTVTIIHRRDGNVTGTETVERAIFHDRDGDYVLVDGMRRRIADDNIVYDDCTTVHLTEYEMSFDKVLEDLVKQANIKKDR